MKSITGKVVICVILILLALAPMRPSSAQFTCDSGGGGGNPPPTPTPTPDCHYEYWQYIESSCDPIAGYCCEDTYHVEDYYCYGVLVTRNVSLISHFCWEN